MVEVDGFSLVRLFTDRSKRELLLQESWKVGTVEIVSRLQ